MKVSVIIPCFNNAEFISKAITSALEQSHKDVEIIVINDGSTDRSPEIIAEFGDQITFINQTNKGACFARNVGLSIANGDWVKFLDGDDWLKPDCLTYQLADIQSKNDVIFGYPEIVDEYENPYHDPMYVDAETLPRNTKIGLPFFFQHPITTTGALYPTHILRQFGAFNPSIRREQEKELNIRLFLNGVSYLFSPVECFSYRQHKSSSRISVARLGDNYFSEIRNFEWLVQLAQNGPRSKGFSESRKFLGVLAWRTGRYHARKGNVKSALTFFSLADKLDGSNAVYGTKLYKTLTMFIRPVFLERVGMFIKGLVPHRRDD